MSDRAVPRVLVLARNYPNNVLPTLGIWTRRMVHASRAVARPTVVAPVPYVPPGVPLREFAKYRDVQRQRSDDGIDVHHPRVPAGPGYLLHSFEAKLQYPLIRRLTDSLHRQQPWDMIHAHFIYPDGVIAARLGERYGVPVISTEHAPWLPWFDDYPRVRRQVEAILPGLHRVTALTESHRANLAAAVGDAAVVELLPNVVDECEFPAPAPDQAYDPERILFVGVVRRVKGLDVLVRAFSEIAVRRPNARLVAVGAAYYRGYQRDEQQVRALIGELGLASRVEFRGQASPAEVAETMRTSAVLVVPSRRETFSAVTIEALASGTPVVATRCGGPEEVLGPESGRLVPVDDAHALADAIEAVLVQRPDIDPLKLRADVLARFGSAQVAARMATLYASALGRTSARATPALRSSG